MYAAFRDELAALGISLVAVSKTQPPERLHALYEQGQRRFGENRVPEMLEKSASLPGDIEWHFIGHLQTNKVKALLPVVHLIHSVDSARLLREINRQAALAGRTVDCLLQFHIAREETKFGFTEEEAREMLTNDPDAPWPHVRLCGVMGMASFTPDLERVRREFAHLHLIFDRLKNDFFADQPHFRERSMGMSGDWRLAVEAGTTMVRLGSAVF